VSLLGLSCRSLTSAGSRELSSRPAFPQRSPLRLLPAAACGGLRSAPDHRTRRALLHLSYSCAPQITPPALVTHDPKRSSSWSWGWILRNGKGRHSAGVVPDLT